MSLQEYYLLAVSQTKPAVETFTGLVWELPTYGEMLKESHDKELLALRKFPSMDLYRYLVYLRHHRFPSPLLDWTASSYIAAFFAFTNPSSAAEMRSIYVYCEMPKGQKGGAVGAPTILSIGPYVRSHPRHFRQQSNYTICGRFDSDWGWRFCPHETVIGTNPRQDALWKFNLPESKRIKILRLLNDYNLNAYSLFDSQETLLETMWFREYVLNQSRFPSCNTP